MPDWYSRPSPYVLLILGAITFFGAVISTYTGKSWGRFGGFVYRAKEPKQFWQLVAIYYLGSVIFIGMFLYAVT
jgi:hypothetical protein